MVERKYYLWLSYVFFCSLIFTRKGTYLKKIIKEMKSASQSEIWFQFFHILKMMKTVIILYVSKSGKTHYDYWQKVQKMSCWFYSSLFQKKIVLNSFFCRFKLWKNSHLFIETNPKLYFPLYQCSNLIQRHPVLYNKKFARNKVTCSDVECIQEVWVVELIFQFFCGSGVFIWWNWHSFAAC